MQGSVPFSHFRAPPCHVYSGVVSQQRLEAGISSNIDVIGSPIVDAAYKLHTGLGPGMMEKTYEHLLAKELIRRGFKVDRQKPVRFEYDGIVFDGDLIPDLLVDDLVVVEIKAVERVLPVHRRQVYTYLRALDLNLGYLLNFGRALMKDGIYRIVNDYRPTPDSPLRIHRRR